MKILADENFYQENIDVLIELGFDTTSIKELGLSGIPDDKVIKKAIESNRVLLTLDRRLVDIRKIPQEHPGIIVFKLKPLNIETINLCIYKHFHSIEEISIKNKIVVLEEEKLRVR